MKITTIRAKLHRYIDAANDKKLEAIFSMVKKEMEEKYDHWEDEGFLAEIKSRIDDIENGNNEGLSWEEVKLKARSEYKEKHDLMKQASSDPLFLDDMKNISDDFAFIDKDI